MSSTNDSINPLLSKDESISPLPLSLSDNDLLKKTHADFAEQPDVFRTSDSKVLKRLNDPDLPVAYGKREACSFLNDGHRGHDLLTSPSLDNQKNLSSSSLPGSEFHNFPSPPGDSLALTNSPLHTPPSRLFFPDTLDSNSPSYSPTLSANFFCSLPLPSPGNNDELGSNKSGLFISQNSRAKSDISDNHSSKSVDINDVTRAISVPGEAKKRKTDGKGKRKTRKSEVSKFFTAFNKIYVYDNKESILNITSYAQMIKNLIENKNIPVKKIIPMTALGDINFFNLNEIVVGDLNYNNEDALAESVIKAIKNSPDTLFILVSGNQERVDMAKKTLAKADFNTDFVHVFIKPLNKKLLIKPMEIYENYISNQHSPTSKGRF